MDLQFLHLGQLGRGSHVTGLGVVLELRVALSEVLLARLGGLGVFNFHLFESARQGTARLLANVLQKTHRN